MMDNPKSFRSAFNGFNREDVVRYIDYLNTQHQNQINQLNSQLEMLRTRQNSPTEPEAEDIAAQQAARIRELFDRCAALEAERDALREAPADPAELNALKEENTRLRGDLAALRQEPLPAKTDDELQAYRRAERVERMAQERAEQLYRQANAVLSDAGIQVGETADQIGSLADRIMTQLEELRAAISAGKQALQDASATMYTLRPNSED